MADAVHASHLTCRFRRTHAVSDLSFSIPEGRLFALLGPNGAGKTTMLRTIAGLLPVWRGRITFDGARIDGLRPYDVACRGITLVPRDGACSRG